MGNSSSKAARAAGSAARKYPQRASAEATQAAKSANPASPANPPRDTPSTSADPASTAAPSQQGPTSHTEKQPSEDRTEAIDLDARDPGLASRLSELGPVKPYPTYSPSSQTGSAATPQSQDTPTSTSRNTDAGASAGGIPATKSGVFPSPATNPAVAILASRQRIQQQAEEEKGQAGRKGFQGKTFADVSTVRKMLVLRDEQGMPEGQIEEALGLKRGTVARLGRVGVVEAA